MNTKQPVLLHSTLHIQTYNTDFQVPDSAGTATAYLCGVKGKRGSTGVDDTLQDRGHCPSAKSAEVTSIADWAIAEGQNIFELIRYHSKIHDQLFQIKHSYRNNKIIVIYHDN